MVTTTQTTLNALQLEAGMGSNGMFFSESFQDNITAFAAGGQANATPLTRQNNRITTAVNPNASVALPPALPGLEVFLIHHTANSVQVFGNGSDQVNDAASS